MEENREPRNKLTQIQSTDLWQRTNKIQCWRIAFSTNDAPTTGHPHAKKVKINLYADNKPFIRISSKGSKTKL